MTRKRTCKPFFMFIIIMHTVMMRMRTIFDVHRHGRGTYMNRRMYFMLITYQVLAYCVLLLVRDVRGDLRDTRQLTTSQINNQQTVHASYMGKIHLYQYIFYVVHTHSSTTGMVRSSDSEGTHLLSSPLWLPSCT